MPGPVKRAKRGLMTFGDSSQCGLPVGAGSPGFRIGSVPIQCLPPHLCYCADICRAALPAFDLERPHPGPGQLGQQLQGIQAGWLFEGVKRLAIDLETAFADSRISGVFFGVEAVNQHTVETHCARAIGGLFPAYETRRRTHAVSVG